MVLDNLASELVGASALMAQEMASATSRLNELDGIPKKYQWERLRFAFMRWKEQADTLVGRLDRGEINSAEFAEWEFLKDPQGFYRKILEQTGTRDDHEFWNKTEHPEIQSYREQL